MDWLRVRDKSFKLWGVYCSQVPSALLWFNRIIQENEIKAVLEIGTYCGGTTGWFGVALCDSVLTVDITDKHISQKSIDLFKKLGVRLIITDAHKVSNVNLLFDTVKEMANGGRVFVFCDGGNKHLEFGLYGKVLESGDLIAAHDCGKEFFPEKVMAEARGMNCIRKMARELDADNTLLALYEKG